MGAGYRPEPEYSYDPSEAPDIRILWQKRIKRTRKPWLCEACGKWFEAGTPKDSCGLVEDGTFAHIQTCPSSGCAFGYPAGTAMPSDYWNGRPGATDAVGHPLPDDFPY